MSAAARAFGSLASVVAQVTSRDVPSGRSTSISARFQPERTSSGEIRVGVMKVAVRVRSPSRQGASWANPPRKETMSRCSGPPEMAKSAMAPERDGGCSRSSVSGTPSTVSTSRTTGSLAAAWLSSQIRSSSATAMPTGEGAQSPTGHRVIVAAGSSSTRIRTGRRRSAITTKRPSVVAEIIGSLTATPEGGPAGRTPGPRDRGGEA